MRFEEPTTSLVSTWISGNTGGVGLKNGSTDPYADFQSVKLTQPL